MKKIALIGKNGLGKFALVDDKDFGLVRQYKWWYCGGYVISKKSIRIHSLIMNTPKGMQTDHINHNTLDNRRKNLRVCTHSQNQMNQKHQNKLKISQYKGVRLTKKGKYRYWAAVIKLNKITKAIGNFPNEHLAALAYDFWATELFGKFAYTNFKVVAQTNF